MSWEERRRFLHRIMDEVLAWPPELLGPEARVIVEEERERRRRAHYTPPTPDQVALRCVELCRDLYEGYLVRSSDTPSKTEMDAAIEHFSLRIKAVDNPSPEQVESKLAEPTTPCVTCSHNFEEHWGSERSCFKQLTITERGDRGSDTCSCTEYKLK